MQHKSDSTDDSAKLSLPTLHGDSKLLTPELIDQIRIRLPVRCKFYDWRLVYSSELHGFSINTLYNKSRQENGPALLIIKDYENNIFGAYTSDSWKINPGYYGNGECFLFHLSPDTPEFYMATMNNTFFMCARRDLIAIGGGRSGNFGLFIDSELLNGSTGHCETFNNKSLTKKEDFKIYGMEIWTLE